jgi:hypothetical protein
MHKLFQFWCTLTRTHALAPVARIIGVTNSTLRHSPPPFASHPETPCQGERRNALSARTMEGPPPAGGIDAGMCRTWRVEHPGKHVFTAPLKRKAPAGPGPTPEPVARKLPALGTAGRAGLSL